MSGIAGWLAALDLAQYAEEFEAAEITPDLVGELDQETLKELGVSTLGHRLKILKAAKEGEAAPAAEPPAATNEERRQLTIQFCDLVGSTQISSRMDPEDYRELMRVYQETASNVILRYGGYVAQYLGDGLMTFFGYPVALEDAAERAVRSALEIVAEVKAKSPFLGEKMKVRIGIATGTVVVGDIVGQRVLQTSAASGETTNLAARLQGVAQENQVVISGDCKRLMRSEFRYENLGEKTLKGISQPVTAWRVVEEITHEADGASAQDEVFVGRRKELDAALAAWAAARSGEGRITMLCGEAGIGKSRLLREYLTATEEHETFRLRFQCSSFFTDTAFHPLRRFLEQEARMAPSDDAETRVDKLVEALERVGGPRVEETAALYASVLSLPVDRFAPLQLSPALQKQRTIEVLVEQISLLVAKRPVQVIYEDAHWADPTSMDALKHFAEQLGDLPVHMVVTFRPEFEPPWTQDGEGVEMLRLERLDGEEVREIIARTVGLEGLSEDQHKLLAERTDGVPLFAQELARAFAEGRATGGDGDAVEVPATLQDSLMARLDRLGSAREAAQLASVIGREFELPLLQKIAGWPEETVRLTLSQLEGADLIERETRAERDVWSFRHALIQDAAYQSILRRRRRSLHAAIADAIVSDDPERAAREPQYLAHHFAEAERSTEAAVHHLTAGRIAWGRAAAKEALAQLDRGLAQALLIDDEETRSKLELQLQSTIGVVHFAATSYASAEAAAAFTRARELCDVVDDTDLQMTVLYGLGTFETMKGDVHAGHQTFVHFSNIADEIGIPRYDVMSASLLTWSYYNRGHYRSSIEYGERVRDLYDEGAWSTAGVRANAADPRVVSDAFMATSLWSIGRVTDAVRVTNEVLAYAEALNDPYSLAYAYTNSSIRALEMVEDWGTVRDRAEKGIALSRELGYFYLATYCDFWRARAMSEMGEMSDATEIAAASMAVIDKLGIGYHRATYAAKYAKMLAAVGRTSEAAAQIDIAPKFAIDSGEFSQEAEVLVLTGDYYMIRGDTAHALKSYDAARRLAAARDEKSWELRAALKIAEIHVDEDRTGSASDVLRPVLDAYPEPGAIGDPVRATALLDRL